MIKAIDIRKSFDNVEVLKGITADFSSGQTNLIIGQSGSGKTVFLKTLLGLIKPDSGKVILKDVSLYDLSEEEMQETRQNMGMVFQYSALFDFLSVEDNVIFPMKMFKNMSDGEMRDRANFVLNRVNLQDANKKFPSEISGGMQKRVAIARAIVLNPEFLFCDEPNSGLDPKTAQVIDNLLKDITEEYDITTIINTHDMNSVMEIGDNIIFLKNGVKEWQGNKEEILYTDNKAVEDFVYSSDLFQRVRQILRSE